MTTPSIEEMVEEFINKPYVEEDGKLYVEIDSHWFRKALTQAHQAGRDEAVDKMKTDVSYIEYNLRQSIKHEREGTNLGKYKMDVDKYLNELHILSSPKRHHQSTTK